MEKIKNWWKPKKEWFKNHPDVSLTLLGGGLSIIGGILKIIANDKEYEDNIFVAANDNSVYKIPAKKMKTSRKVDVISE